MGVELVLLSRVAYRGVEVTGARLGGLLALLAGELRTGCGSGGLIEALWPEDRPAHPAKALQVLVSRARSRLGPDVIVSTPTGYRLSLTEDQVDASAVVRSAAAADRAARDGDHATALRHAEEGLTWCEGATTWDAGADDPLEALRATRVGTYWSLVRYRALALARLDRRGEVVEQLAELARQQPRDEEVLAELLRCEYATVGAPVALARYESYRQGLRKELGSDPGPALREVHRELLLSDAPVVRRGVREEPNPLLGRDGDLEAVVGLLRGSRVVSIVGAGGLGKTRLAHAVGRAAEQRVVQVVGLAGVAGDGDVVVEVAAALEVGEAAGPPPVGRLGGPVDPVGGIVDALGPGPALLVLDNCEHVVGGVARLVQALVSLSRDLRVLATGRAPLGLTSESVYALPELELATTVELFGQRARAARPGVELPADVVGELCARLDGLPLAVELAAVRVRAMSVREIARRLDDRFSLLRGGTRDTPQRHRTLHAVIDWSWQLLEPPAQQAMRLLSVLPGGFDTDAARVMLGGGEADAVLEQLVDQSMVKVADAAAGVRFRMLETVREFAGARREEAGETGRAVDGLLRWAVEFGLAHHEAMLEAGAADAVAAIQGERDNLVRALRFGLERGDAAAVAATAAVLGGLWFAESNFSRLAALAGDTAWVLSHARPEARLVEVTRAAAVLCALAAFLGQPAGLLRTLVTLGRLPQAAPDTLVRATHTVLCAPDVGALRALAERPEPLLAGMAHHGLSYALEYDNDLAGALREARLMLARVEEAAPSERAGPREGPGPVEDAGALVRAVAHSRVAELCLELDPGEAAVRHLTAALSILDGFGWWYTANRGRWALVLAHLQSGAYDEAERGLAVAARGSGGDAIGLALFDVFARAGIALGRGDAATGLRLWRQATERLLAAGDDQPGGGAWRCEAQAIAVVLHVRHGQLDRVIGMVEGLPAAAVQLAGSVSPAGLRICGSPLLALALVDLDRDATAPAARLLALSEAFGPPTGFLRAILPDLTPERVRHLAEQADGPAYHDAVSSYAGLDPAGLRAALPVTLRERDLLRVAGRA